MLPDFITACRQPADSFCFHRALSQSGHTVIVSSTPGSLLWQTFERWAAITNLDISAELPSGVSFTVTWMYLCDCAPTHFKAQMSPTLKLREAAKQRLTMGGVWMKAESLPRGFSTTARKKTHCRSKRRRSSTVANHYLHCCRSRGDATGAFCTKSEWRFSFLHPPFCRGGQTGAKEQQLNTMTTE